MQFRYFLTAARYENLTKAAEELHIAQPALSQSIHRLEQELGVLLFDRKNHRITLNEQGKILAKRLSLILISVDGIKDELWESVYASEQTIRLNFLAASPFITDCIIAYRSLNPDVNFQVSQLENTDSCDIHVDSQASGLEPVPMEEVSYPEGIWKQKILQEEVFLAVSKNSPYASLASVDLRDTGDEGYIRLGHSWRLRGICDGFCQKAGIQPQIIFESNNPESVRNLIAAGLGIGFWPEKSWSGPPGPKVALLPIRYPICRRDLIISICDRAKDKPVVEKFFTFIEEYFSKIKT